MLLKIDCEQMVYQKILVCKENGEYAQELVAHTHATR